MSAPDPIAAPGGGVSPVGGAVPPPSSARAGAVYDRGYRPYEGPRGGRSAARAALWRATVRRSLGLRRNWRQKVTPFVLLGIVTIPAIVNVGVGYLTRNSPLDERIELITYREYVGVSSALLVFVAVVAPDVVCPDRRQRVLPLIFSRPLIGADYVAAKVGAVASIVFAFSFLPQVVLFVGQALVSDAALDYITDNLDVLWKVPVSAAVLALYYSVLGLAVSATTERRVTAGAWIVALFLVTSAASGILTADLGRGEGTAGALLNLLSIPLHVRDLVFLGHVDPRGDLVGVPGAGAAALAIWALVVAGGLAWLLRRYRYVER